MEILYIYEPIIANDTVHFRWNFSRDPYIFKKHEFYIKYDCISIADIDDTVFYEIILGLMIPILNSLKEEILIILPKEISEKTVNFWLSYNETTNVKVFPTVREHRIISAEKIANKKMGILFGGGKDSLYSYKLNQEIFQKENLLLVSFVFPVNYATKNDLDLRRDTFALNQMIEDGVAVQKIYTDFRSIFDKYSFFNTIHTQLYFLMSLPLFLKYNLAYLTYSYEFTHYWNMNNENEPFFHFKKSRPEFDQFLSEYFQDRFEKKIKIYNSNYYLSETLAFQLLNDRYKALNELMMCEAEINTDKKWCEKCYKCGEYVLYCLSNKFEDQQLDFNQFLQESDFIKKTIRSVTKNNVNKRNEDGNIAWFNGLVSPIHYMSFCHVIYSIDLDFWSKRLTNEALSNIKKLKDWFGAKSYRILDMYSLTALKAINLPFEESIINILDQHTVKDDSETIEILYGNQKVKIDYRLSYPLHLVKQSPLKSETVCKEIINLTEPQFNRYFKNEIFAVNKMTNESIPFEAKNDYRGFTFFIKKSAPAKGDTVKVVYTFENLVKDRSYHIRLSILSPYLAPIYKNRLKYSLEFGLSNVLEEDISFWDKDNRIDFFFNPNSDTYCLKIKVESLVDCEPWNWGKAAQIIIKTLEIKPISKIETSHLSWSSPFTKQIQSGG